MIKYTIKLRQALASNVNGANIEVAHLGQVLEINEDQANDLNDHKFFYYYVNIYPERRVAVCIRAEDLEYFLQETYELTHTEYLFNQNILDDCCV